MKSLVAVVVSLGILGIISLVLASLGLTVYGLVLAFKASIVLGVIALLVEPSPLILGLVAVFGHDDIAQRIATWLGL